MINIVTILGARPQFIKAATVSRTISGYNASAQTSVSEIIIHTGQHFDDNMSEVFFRELEIPKPDYNLGIGGGSHGQNAGRMIEAIEEVLVKEKPDWVLVGDTDINSGRG
jgi:UDP-GlcNAc3NAcA epimerase